MSDARQVAHPERGPIEVSVVVAAEPKVVWALVSGFGEVHRWHPLITGCKLEPGRPDGAVGCVRRVSTADGLTLRERLVAISDRERCFSYQILDFPMPVADFMVIVRLHPVSDPPGTLVTLRAEYRAEREDEAAIARASREAFAAAAGALQRRFALKPGNVTPSTKQGARS